MKITLLFLLLAISCYAQAVTDPTSTFSLAQTPSGLPMTDFLADQATGQGADDFVVNGVYLKYANVGGQQTQFVRAIFNNYRANGFGGNFKVGLDVNGDGSLDIVYGVVDTGSNRGIAIQLPTTGSVAPGSTSLNTAISVTPFSITNYNYVLDSTAQDAVLTFAMPFMSVQNTLAAQGINITQDTFFRAMFFTATNQGAINQDIYGVSGINNTLRFDNGGGFGNFENFKGNRPVIPEFGTVIQIGAFLLIGSIIAYRKRNKKIYTDVV